MVVCFCLFNLTSPQLKKHRLLTQALYARHRVTPLWTKYQPVISFSSNPLKYQWKKE